VPDDLSGLDVQHRRGRFVERAVVGFWTRSGSYMLVPSLAACGLADIRIERRHVRLRGVKQTYVQWVSYVCK